MSKPTDQLVFEKLETTCSACGHIWDSDHYYGRPSCSEAFPVVSPVDENNSESGDGT